MFDVDKLWVYGKNKNWKNRFKNSKNNTLPVISGDTLNNGVSYYTNDLYDEKDVFTDSLTISTRGKYSGTVTYHKGKFLLANNILVMQMPNFTLLQKIFIGSLINKLPYGGYNGYPKQKTLKNDIIQLPTKDGEIDFEFMEYFIAELESQHIAKLEAYLKVIGLNNYELTSDEKKSIDNFNNIEWGERRIGDLFKVSVSKGYDAGKMIFLDKTSYTFEFVGRTKNNYGVQGYVEKLDTEPNDPETISISQIGTVNAQIRKNKWYSSQNIFVLNPIDKKLVNLAIIAFINKKLLKYKGYSSYPTLQTLKEQTIQLPIKDGEIDFEYIELFTTAIQKLVIKDVVIYANNKISTTKNVCNSK